MNTARSARTVYAVNFQKVTLLPVGLHVESEIFFNKTLREQSSDKSFLRLKTYIMVVK